MTAILHRGLKWSFFIKASLDGSGKNKKSWFFLLGLKYTLRTCFESIKFLLSWKWAGTVTHINCQNTVFIKEDQIIMMKVINEINTFEQWNKNRKFIRVKFSSFVQIVYQTEGAQDLKSKYCIALLLFIGNFRKNKISKIKYDEKRTKIFFLFKLALQ